MADGTTPAGDEQLPDEDGEDEREQVAGDRGGQPGYDLDEAAAYEAAERDEPDA